MKWALERAWSGQMPRDGFASRADELRTAHLAEQKAAIGSAVNDFFLYDEVLETALMLGVTPAWAGDVGADAFGTLTALARGTPEHEAWEMTKWFDTNYHYVVPEIERPIESLTPLPWRTPLGDGAKWAILGPYSLVKLSKVGPGLDRAQLARSAGRAIWTWAREQAKRDPGFRLQVDEPSLGLVLDDSDRAIRDAAYADAADLGTGSAAPVVTVQFGAASADNLEKLGQAGFAVQVPLASAPALQGSAAWAAQPEHVLAVMDGRSVWPDDFEAAKRTLAGLPDDGKIVRLIPS
ncbi:MAG: hypothetical protein ABI841_06815, partial [Chloroflexota bacterium]